MDQFLDKKSPIFCLIAVLFFSAFSICYSQSITGTWAGKLDLGLQKLPLVFNFEPAPEGWKGSLDSPQQNAFGAK